MILQDKTTGVKVVLDINEITLEDLKDTANRICRANQQTFDRTLILTFPAEKNNKSLRNSMDELNKVYECIAEEANRMIKYIERNNLFAPEDRELPIAEDKEANHLKLQEVRFNEIFIAGLGNLIIKPHKFKKNELDI